jgi:gliding motility-associated-like protein
VADITYTLAVTSADGCVAKDSMLVTVLKTPLVPNAFSPNGDGLYDNFGPIGNIFGVSDYKLVIYNRWGEKVFESHDQKMGWDGTYKGAPQDMDAYIYTVSATLIDGEKVALKGNITLLR